MQVLHIRSADRAIFADIDKDIAQQVLGDITLASRSNSSGRFSIT